MGYGAIADVTADYFRKGLEKMTEGDTAAPVVIFCLEDCWMSWNAARSAIEWGYTNVYWMYSVLVQDDFPLTRDELIIALREQGIDSRPFFHPLDTLPMYHSDTPRPVALDLSRRGLNLPSSPKITNEQIIYICQTLRKLAQ